MTNPEQNAAPDEDYVDIDPDSERNPIVPAGMYGSEQEARVVACQVKDDTDREGSFRGKFLNLGIFLADSPVGPITVWTRRFDTKTMDENRNTKNLRSNAPKFLRQLLKVDKVESFKPSELLNLPVVVKVGLNQWADKATGEQREANFVADVWRK